MTTSARRLRKAVLPVAGLGTRVLPGTKTTPKELLNVVDRPILSYIVEEAREAGIEHIVFVTGRSKGAIEDYFDHQIELEAQLLAKGKTDILEMMNAQLASAGEMSFTRQISATGTLSAPCVKMNAFWASENADAFMVFHSFPAREISAENSNVP